MPPKPFPPSIGIVTRLSRLLPFLLSSGAFLAGRSAGAEAPDPTPVRSRTVELHYRLTDAQAGVKVELWYTRDRSANWQRFSIDEDGVSPILFTAPAEGLYGFKLVIRQEGTPPASNEAPQRWVFIDYNPPLVQWGGVEVGDDFAARRIVYLRWTAYDDHLSTRPVALAYQSSIDGKWQTIDSALPNSGRYDWTAPPDLAGQISLKLTVSDLGGHAVERIHGPMPIERWARTPATQPALAATQPAAEVTPATAGEPPSPIDLEKRLKAQDLHRQGAWHLQSGRYAVAAERFREALEADPELVAAECDLAGIHYLQQDYTKALELYNAILARDNKNTAAMRGASLAYVALKQYPQSREVLTRLLATKDKDAQAWLDLGDVLFMMGDTVTARGHWTRATTADSTAEMVVRKARRRLELYGTDGEAAAAGNR